MKNRFEKKPTKPGEMHGEGAAEGEHLESPLDPAQIIRDSLGEKITDQEFTKYSRLPHRLTEFIEEAAKEQAEALDQSTDSREKVLKYIVDEIVYTAREILNNPDAKEELEADLLQSAKDRIWELDHTTWKDRADAILADAPEEIGKDEQGVPILENKAKYKDERDRLALNLFLRDFKGNNAKQILASVDKARLKLQKKASGR